MEGRMKYRQVSPERAKAWTEKSPKPHQNRKVPVVYYLCRNRQLEHPHFMEVSLSSPDGLYLRDVIDRLNVLRGRGMASMYSWSCKRSYKNGFVWHDVCEDDLILPAHGNEYVLKGSELFEEFNSGGFSPTGNLRLQNMKQLPEPASSRSQDDFSSSSNMNGRDTKCSHNDELSPPPVQHLDSPCVSPESGVVRDSSCGGSLSMTEYKVYRSDGLANASTQTEETSKKIKTQESCTRGVSTDDGSTEHRGNDVYQSQAPCVKVTSEICGQSISPPPSSSASSLAGKTETLESLIRADASKLNSFRILEEEEYVIPSKLSNTKLKGSNMLMQLISCGSISVKDHSFGLIPTYRPNFSRSRFASPLFSPSIVLGNLDCLTENPKLMGLKLEDKEYFSGSLIEKNITREKGHGFTLLKRSSSYNADRTSKYLESVADHEEATSTRSKCIPRSLKASLSRQPRSESMRYPVSEGPRISSEGFGSSKTIPIATSNGSSKRITEPSSGKKQTARVDTAKEETEHVFKIEERLTSGARIIIHSKAPCNPHGNCKATS